MSTLQTTNLKHPDASGNQITFTSGGLVGVGTSSPGYPLTIACNGNAQGISLEGRSADDIGEFTFFENDGTTQLGRLQGRQSYFQISATDNTKGIFIDNSSNVGIGAATVADVLHIQTNTTGRLLIGPDGASIYHNKIYNDNGDLMISSEGSASDIIVGSNRDVIFRTGGVAGGDEVARFTDDNVLLVNTTTWSGDNRLQVNGPLQVQGLKIAEHSRSYTPSTSAQDLFQIRFVTGHGAAELTWMFVDGAYPNGVRVGKIYLAFRGSGSNIAAVSSSSNTEGGIANGTVTQISWTASVLDTSHIKLTATGTATSGTGSMYIYGFSPYFDGLTPISDV